MTETDLLVESVAGVLKAEADKIKAFDYGEEVSAEQAAAIIAKAAIVAVLEGILNNPEFLNDEPRDMTWRMETLLAHYAGGE